MYKLIQEVLRIPKSYAFNGGSFSQKVLTPVLTSYIQTRNTYILKRRYPVKLCRKGVEKVRLKGKDYVYDLVENTDVIKKPQVQVILKQFVEGLGNRGDVVTVSRNIAYNKLLLTGLADYGTPEAIEKANAEKEKEDNTSETYSSPTVPKTIRFLESQVLCVTMNMETEWTIMPWHIRVSFRKAGIHVPEHCILLPSQPILGPDAELEGKEFCVTVTINNKEKANVRCRIHHWSTNPADRLPRETFYWVRNSEPIFAEETEKLRKLTLCLPLQKKMKAIMNATTKK